MSSIFTSIDFGHSFNKEMRELAFLYDNFQSIPKSDLSRLYSKIPVAFIVEALDESEKEDFIKSAFKPSDDFLFRDYLEAIIHNYYMEEILDLFNIENTHIRHYGLPASDPMIEAGFCIGDFINIKEFNRIPSYAI